MNGSIYNDYNDSSEIETNVEKPIYNDVESEERKKVVEVKRSKYNDTEEMEYTPYYPVSEEQEQEHGMSM